MRKISVILFNLGGPSSLDEVEKYLFNLFYDKAILPLPNPFRWLMATLLAKSRKNKSKSIFKKIGNRSPILEQTIEQAEALEVRLNEKYDTQVLVSMRYHYPKSEDIVDKIVEHTPDDIILLPLYPHFSISTSKSSIDDFLKNIPNSIKHIRKRVICCYPTEENFIRAHQQLLKETIEGVEKKDIRVIFSAHGLPEYIINSGDPYQSHIIASCEKIMDSFPGIDWRISYQSRVGPVKWLEPTTEDTIREASLETKDIAIVPISFVSEHSETLVELDIDYRQLSVELGIRNFYRVPTLQINSLFIDSLEDMCNYILSVNQTKNIEIYSQSRYRLCSNQYCKCINNQNVS